MIKYYNRNTKRYEVENVAGEKYLKWTYSSPFGMGVLEMLIKKKLFSKLYGLFCDRKRSKKKIATFVKDFDIDMSQSVKGMDEFQSFNDFFTRKIKEEERPIDSNEQTLISPGDGKLLAFENINLEQLVQVKGFTYSLKSLINNKEIANQYIGGTCLILRLSPTDYHRFHFIDDGICEATTKITGDYYSVNPIALEKIPELFCKNKREWSVFHAKNFGDILHIEVGATCVGSIIQTYHPHDPIKKGGEKGYFKFGGSTIILFFEKGKVQIDQDIINETNKGYESQVLMGEKIGKGI